MRPERQWHRNNIIICLASQVNTQQSFKNIRFYLAWVADQREDLGKSGGKGRAEEKECLQ